VKPETKFHAPASAPTSKNVFGSGTNHSQLVGLRFHSPGSNHLK